MYFVAVQLLSLLSLCSQLLSFSRTSIDGTDKGVLRLDTGNIRDSGDVKKGSSTGHDVLAKSSVTSNQVGKAVFLLDLGEKRGKVLRKTVGVRSVLGCQYLGYACVLGNSLSNSLRSVTCDKGSDRASQLARSRQSVQRGTANLTILVLDNKKRVDTARTRSVESLDKERTSLSRMSDACLNIIEKIRNGKYLKGNA